MVDNKMYRIGDRLEGGTTGLIFEITGDCDEYNLFPCICVAAGDKEVIIKIGGTYNFLFKSATWKFIGNYAKSENLTTLYDILCETQK